MNELTGSLVVILSSVPWSWSTDYVNQTAEYLRKNNTVVCFLADPVIPVHFLIRKAVRNGFWKPCGRNLLLVPYIQFVPLRRFGIVRPVNDFLNAWAVRCLVWIRFRRKSFDKRILWIFHPKFHAYPDWFGPRYTSIYDCVDYFQGAEPTAHDRVEAGKENETLIMHADIVCVNSNTLKTRFGHLRRNIEVVPQGFRLDRFRGRIVSRIRIPHTRPVIGYVGGINDRLDFRLLFSVISRNPSWLFVFAGPITADRGYAGSNGCFRQLIAMENVMVLPELSKNAIPGLIAQFDIGMIPYASDSTFNRYCYPMKIMEYFYLGKPVVSTPIDELRCFPSYVRIGSTPQQWKRHIAGILDAPLSRSERTAMKRIALDNTWNRKISAILALITEAPSA